MCSEESDRSPDSDPSQTRQLFENERGEGEDRGVHEEGAEAGDAGGVCGVRSGEEDALPLALTGRGYVSL
jgi:hypothetical protein